MERKYKKTNTGQGSEPFHQENAWDDAISAFLREPFADTPGETFRYNTGATYMLSAALKQRGIDLEEHLRDKLWVLYGFLLKDQIGKGGE